MNLITTQVLLDVHASNDLQFTIYNLQVHVHVPVHCKQQVFFPPISGDDLKRYARGML